MKLLRHRRAARFAAAALFAMVLAGGQHASGNPSFGSQPGIVFERGGDLFAVSLDGRRTVRLTHTPVWDEDTPALAIKRAQGVQLGRPRKMSEVTVERIRELERLGMSASDIAHELNAEGVPTATGRGRWHPPGVARALSWVRS